jgi:hypothetical protein
MPPAMLIDALHGVRRRVKILSIVFGVGVAIACAIGLTLTVIFLDYLLDLPAIPRVALTLTALLGVAWVIVRWIGRPAAARMSLADIAGRLERAFPQFDDRLRSTVDFAGGRPIFGSEVMQQRVISEAADLAGRMDLNRAVVAKPAWYSASGGIAAILLVALLAGVVVNPVYTRIALSRLLSPFSQVAWPKRVQIELIGNVPQRVPVGERIELRMKLGRGDRSSMRARVFYQVNDGPVAQEFMMRGPDGVYSASLDARSDPLRASGAMKIWMTAGDDRMDLAPISVLPRLAIKKVEALVTPPKYIADGPDGAKPAVANLADGTAIVPAGSEVALQVSFNKALAGGDDAVKIQPLPADAMLPIFVWRREGTDSAQSRWTAGESLRFHVQGTDVDGFHNTALEEYELVVRPDQNPTVQIEFPRRNEDRTPVASVPLQAVAEDDYGIGALKLEIDRLNDKHHWEIELVKSGAPDSSVSWNRIEGSAERLCFRANYSWDLGKLDPSLKPGDILEYHLLVSDNFNLNGAAHVPVASGKLRITVISQEQFTEAVAAELRTAAGQIHDILTRQTRNRQETAELAKDTASKPEFDAGDRAVADRLGNQEGTAASQSKQIASRLASLQQRMEENKSAARDLHDLAGDVKDVLNNAAEDPMKSAAGQIASASQQKSDPKSSAAEQKKQIHSRNQTMGGSVENQQRAADQLQSALDKLGSVGSLAQTIDRIRAILAEQQRISKETAAVGNDNLGRRPQDMSAEDRARLEKVAGEQQALAGKTDKALAEMQKLSEQMSKTDPSASEAMKQAAATGQGQQVTPNQSRAAQEARQNQQANAQAAQKQAEIGLEMMLNDLREAERRKLEELSRKLAEVQQQIANLIRRQAGHNLDDLSLQGPDRIKKIDGKLIAELLSKSDRVKDHLPPIPDLPQLTGSQEQTERNTRDIAHSIEEMPSAAEPASNLTRAASRMERAIVSLRAKELAAAYEPPQVEALAALEEAKRIIDEQKNAVDQKREQQQREAIRQAYTKIKEDQEKLNGETSRIDKAPKLADGNLKREDALRLGQLPGEEGKLSDRTGKLEEDLSALGSIVYIWANKDIVTSMNLVKDELGKPVTGPPTQAEQVRVVQQLDAMIKSLEVKPLERRFASRSGGGGGQCSPKLPPEAELRLLKQLQQAVNQSTRTLDVQPQKDKPKVMALGNRQGELRKLLDETLQKSTGGEM